MSHRLAFVLGMLAIACDGTPAPGPDAGPPPDGSRPPILLGETIARVSFENRGASPRSDVIVTFGHPFAPGDVPASAFLAARTEDGAPIDLQIDQPSTHADGSLAFA